MARNEPPIIGEDGELTQPDTNIDKDAYAEYVTSVKSRSEYTMNEWDDSRIVEVMFVAIGVAFCICMLCSLLSNLVTALRQALAP